MSTNVPKSWPVTPLLGIPVDCPPGPEALHNALQAQIATPQSSWHVVTMNAEMAYAATLNPALMGILQRAELVIPDGIGVVWALGRQGVRVQRLPGVEIVETLLARASREPLKLAILGSSPETLEALQAVITQRYGHVPLAYCQHGYFKPEDEAKILADIQAARPDVLFVALGVPRQENWIAEHRKDLQIPLLIGVGGSFDVISGRLQRAPEWMRRLHLEWFFRLLQQPTRWRRMLALPQFVLKVLRT
ncbi:MAG: WecB/TagA/CpsF family glycosyltransferase [Candidatus Sericytochromatia bacterium]